MQVTRAGDRTLQDWRGPPAKRELRICPQDSWQSALGLARRGSAEVGKPSEDRPPITHPVDDLPPQLNSSPISFDDMNHEEVGS
jgi:hypothetical protein